MSTPAPGRRSRTTIRRKLAITAGAVLAAGAMAVSALAAPPAHASAPPDTVQLLGFPENGADFPALSHNIHNTDNGYQGWNMVEGNGGAEYFDDGQGGIYGSSIAGLPDGSTQVVAVGVDYNLYHNIRFANGGWQGWVAIEGNGGAKYFHGVDPSIAGMPDGSSQVVEQGYDSRTLYHNIRFASGRWQGWIPVEGLDGSGSWSTTAVIASLPNGSSQVFDTSPTWGAWENTRASDGIWSGWTSVPGGDQTVAAAGFGSVS